jgi:hypothetical protein
MDSEWLIERCTTTDPDELQRQDFEGLELSDEKMKRFLKDRAEQHQRWVQTEWNPFVGQMLLGDELWRFCSPEDTWANLAGCAGYSIVRDGVVLDSLVTLRN